MPRSLRLAPRAVPLIAAVAAAGLAAPLHAQLVARAAPPTPPPARQTASVNLLGLPFGFVSGEYERAVGTEGLAIGLGGSATFDRGNTADLFNDNGYGDDRFSSLQAKVKYYPVARGLRGFAIGLTAGVASAGGWRSQLVGFDTVTVPGAPGGPFTNPVFRTERVRDTRPTVGSVLDYNFLIGRRQRFLIGLGVGARRVLGSRGRREQPFDGYGYGYTNRDSPLGRTLFDGRLQVGLGF